MKKSLLTALLFATSSAAVAQYYEPIPYYNNNPYIFCTVGVPQDCWAPISKELGTFTVTNYYCFNAYSAFLFARVCPRAFALGAAQSVMKAASTQDPADASP